MAPVGLAAARLRPTLRFGRAGVQRGKLIRHASWGGKFVSTSLYTILCIVIRVGAVVLGVNALSALLTVLASVRAGELPGDLWVSFASVGATLLIAFLLWTWPGFIARIAAGRSSGQVFESPIDAAQIQRIALSVLGAWLVVEGLASLAHFALEWVVFMDLDKYDTALPDRVVSRGVYWIIQIVLGLLLALNAGSLTGLLQRLRDGSLRGGPAPVPDEGDPSAERS